MSEVERLRARPRIRRERRVRIAAGAVLVVSIISFVGAPAPPASASFPGQVGRIVFVDGDADGDLYAINASGTGRNRLTKDAGGTKLYPAWSPDGRTIAYSAPTDAPNGRVSDDVFLVNADGRNKQRLTHGLLAYVPRWSPDGTRLLLTVQRGPQFRAEVLALDAGSRPRSLFRDARRRNGATWSPDGERIAYQADSAVYVARFDGSGSRKLTTGLFQDWFPDGRSLAVSRGLALFRVGLDGSSDEILPSRPGGAGNVAVSPDARQLVFSAGVESGNSTLTHLFVANLGGSATREISGGTDSDMPSWQSLCTIYGTDRADLLRGTAAADKICGLGGNDVILGGRGDDIVLGGNGADTITGGSGEDWLFGAAGRDSLIARDRERDIVDGGPGADRASADLRRGDRLRGVEHALRP